MTTIDPAMTAITREETERQGRRLLTVFAGVDVVGGSACVILAGPIRDWLGMDGAGWVFALGVAQLVLAAFGAAGSRAPAGKVAEALRRQAVLNAACAVLLVVAAVAGGAHAAGTALLVVLGLAVAGLAALQVALAARSR